MISTGRCIRDIGPLGSIFAVFTALVVPFPSALDGNIFSIPESAEPVLLRALSGVVEGRFGNLSVSSFPSALALSLQSSVVPRSKPTIALTRSLISLPLRLNPPAAGIFNSETSTGVPRVGANIEGGGGFKPLLPSSDGKR
jgi:hypothetical protein